MGEHASIRILPRPAAVFCHIRLSEHITVLIQNLAPDYPLGIGVLPGIIWAAYDIPALHYIEICDISHQNKEQTYEYIGDSSELFVSGALCLFPALVCLVGLFAVFAGHLPFFFASF